MAESTLEMAKESYGVAYVTAVCATTLLYDYVITVGDEIRRMWPSPLSFPKALFLINRYVVVTMLVFNGIVSSRNHLSAPSPAPLTSCVFYLRWLVVTITVTNATVDGILLFRVWALYRRNTPVLVLVLTLYFCGVATLTGLTIKDYVGEAVNIVEDFSALPGCYAASVPSIIAGYWIAPVIIESVFFILIILRYIRWSRDNLGVPPALVLMARDSAVYFAVIFALLIVNLFVFEYAPPFLSSLFVTPANTAGCIAGSRMLLNLRGINETGLTDSELEMTKMSALNFSSGANKRVWRPHFHPGGATTGASTTAPSTRLGFGTITTGITGMGTMYTVGEEEEDAGPYKPL